MSSRSLWVFIHIVMWSLAVWLCIVLAVQVTDAKGATGPSYHSQNERAWRCIRWHETVASSGYRDDRAHARQVEWGYYDGTYAGAYNMDSTFERDHGSEFVRRWGRSNHWPRWAQTVTADRGLRVQGWSAWPTTSRLCNLR
jgi:hypothetical protein